MAIDSRPLLQDEAVDHLVPHPVDHPGDRVAARRSTGTTPVIDSVGKNAELMNSAMNVSGNTFCTASADPVRRASMAANPPITSASTMA